MYDTIARFYDLTHDELTEDLALILALAQESAGPVLELGCGTGRILMPLARAGQRVVGLDNSAAMLARARGRISAETPAVAARIELIEGDMLALGGLTGPFELVIVPYNTLLHLTAAEQGRLFQQVAVQLAPGGRLLIDLANPFELLAVESEDGFALEAALTDAETGQEMAQWSRIRVDSEAQRMTIEWRYVMGEEVLGEVSAEYHVQYPHQLEMQVHQAGLRLVALWGDYDRQPFDADESDRLLMLVSAV